MGSGQQRWLSALAVRNVTDSNPLRSFRERNVRIFFGGLWISTIGTWAHNIAMVLLVRELGGTGIQLGIAAACQFGPLLLLGLYAGAVADRVDRYRTTLRLQSAMGVVALVLAAVIFSGDVNLGLVYGLTFIFGTLSAFDNPTRRTLSTELVPPENTGNILALGTSVMTSARVVGPALAALLASAHGTEWVFLLNGVSYLSFLFAMARLDQSRLHPIEPAEKSKSPVREGLAAVWTIPALRLALVIFAVISTFAYNHSVGLPLLVADTLGRDDVAFGWLMSMMSVGNVMGSLLVARMHHIADVWVYRVGLCLGLTLGALALSTSLWMALILVVPFGMSGTAFVNITTVVTQQDVSPQMRSRVLAITAVLFIGSTPIGGPITGLVGDTINGMWANLYGAIISIVIAIWGMVVAARRGVAMADPVQPGESTT